MTFSQYKKTAELFFIKHERLLVGSFFLVFALLTLFDVLEDLYHGASIFHVAFEIIIVLLTLAVSALFIRTFIKYRNRDLASIRFELDKTKAAAMVLEGQTQKLKEGVSKTISEQLLVWKLTDAEQDVAFLLIKGLSLREISELRHSTERTIRQQSSSIYKKSGLSGRAELSAFFIEDLLAR